MKEKRKWKKPKTAKTTSSQARLNPLERHLRNNFRLTTSSTSTDFTCRAARLPPRNHLPPQ